MRASAPVVSNAGPPRALAKRVRELAASPRLLQELGGNKKAYAVEHFDRRDESRTFEVMLLDIVREEGPANGLSVAD
jgi:hypothetical protein